MSGPAPAVWAAHPRSWTPAILIAIFCGALLALCYRSYDGSLPAWIALAPVLALVAQVQGRALAIGCAAAFSLTWTFLALSFLFPLTVPGTIAACLFTSSFYVLGLVLIRHLARRGVFCAVFGTAALWTLIELARSKIPIVSFPWLLLGQTLLYDERLRQGADLLGVYGLSFIVAACNAALAFALSPQPAPAPGPRQGLTRKLTLAAVAVLILADLGYGQFQLSRLTPLLRAGPPIGVIQGNIKNKLDRTPKEYEAQLQRHFELQHQVLAQGQAASQPPLLVCWAETMAPDEGEESVWTAGFKEEVRQNAVSTLAGANYQTGGQCFNAAVLLDAKGCEVGHYCKRRLVPFGEYLPLKDTLPFLNCLQSVTRDRFQPGVEPAPIWEVGGRRLAVNICVEDTHPDLCRQAVQQGAEALINLTNDGWFYGTYGPRAHLQAAAWRAIELRRPLLRVTNTGATVAVDPLGNIKMLILPETEGVAIARLMHLTGANNAPGTLWIWLGEDGVSLIMIVILSAGVLITYRKRIVLENRR